jgi:AraC-like DNA-binding protein
MAVTLFHITNTAVIIGCLLVAWGIFIHGRQFGSNLRLRRRIVATAFTFLALHHSSLLTIIRPEGVEVYATQPICLLYVAFLILVMGGTAIMNRRYHQNFALWVLMLIIPFTFLLVNSLMIALGLYQPLFHWDELLDFRSNTPMFFYGRMLFVSFLLVFWLLAACMLIEAYLHDRRLRAKRPMSEDAEYHTGEVRFVLGWAAIIVTEIVVLCLPSLIPHIVMNMLMIAGLTLTAIGYRQLVRYLRARAEGRLAPVLISRRIPLLLSMEQAGTTAWGTAVQQNPFFNGNPMLDDVAQALGVRSTDVSEYVQKQGINFMAWVSDQRLRHSAELITTTDRKIAEIATALGYNDLPTFTRAFKRQFGMAHSEYRRKECDKPNILP